LFASTHDLKKTIKQSQAVHETANKTESQNSSQWHCCNLWQNNTKDGD